MLGRPIYLSSRKFISYGEGLGRGGGGGGLTVLAEGDA